MTVAPGAVGVDVGGTKILAVRLDGAGALAGETRRPTPADGAAALAGIIAAVEEVSAGAGGPTSLGVGIPALVDARGGARFSPHLPGLVGVDVVGTLNRRWPGVPVWVGNDATAAGWAEQRRGAATGVADVLMVTIGTGIGGGIVTGGRLAEGAHRYAGEFGHMVVDPHGPRCPCGKQGCWERYASGTGLGNAGREAAMAGEADRVTALAGGDPEAVRGEHVTVAAREGDAQALAIMARFAWWLALGLANLANAFDPEMIVIGGGLVDAGDVLLAPTRRAFATLVEAGPQRGEVAIVAAALGSSAGALGAALLAQRG